MKLQNMFKKVLKEVAIKQRRDGKDKKSMKEYGVTVLQVIWNTDDREYYEMPCTECLADTRNVLNQLVKLGYLRKEQFTIPRNSKKMNIYYLTEKAEAYVQKLRADK